jgi:hypothetical protein
MQESLLLGELSRRCGKARADTTVGHAHDEDDVPLQTLGSMQRRKCDTLGAQIDVAPCKCVDLAESRARIAWRATGASRQSPDKLGEGLK